MLHDSLTVDHAADIATNALEEYVPCNLCGSDSFVLKFVGKDRNYNLPGKFSVVECDVCGLLYTNPRPTKQSLTHYYPQTYWGSHVSNTLLRRAASKLNTMLVNSISYKISISEPTDGKLLDIGCGVGSYLASMKQIGWDAYGVELSSVACEFARRKTGLNVFNGTVEEASFPRNSFGVITAHQVLEHTQDPTETLCEIHRILAADGLLAISVPDAESLESKMFGSAWHNWELPRHLYHFSRATIIAMLEKNGFSEIDVKHDPNPFGVLRSIEYVFADIELNPKIGFALAYPLSFLIAIVLGTLHSSGSMAIYARKRQR